VQIYLLKRSRHKSKIFKLALDIGSQISLLIQSRNLRSFAGTIIAFAKARH